MIESEFTTNDDDGIASIIMERYVTESQLRLTIHNYLMDVLCAFAHVVKISAQYTFNLHANDALVTMRSKRMNV